jgi:hypothetical protein
MELEIRQIDILNKLKGIERRVNDVDQSHTLETRQDKILHNLNQIANRIEHLEKGQVFQNTSNSNSSLDIGPIGTRVLNLSKDMGLKR